MRVLSPSSAFAIASLSVCVQGHGYISKPKATYEPNTMYTRYNALTTASINAGFNGGKYDGSPADNAKAFTDHWNATGYKSLREMVDPIAPNYGKSIQTVDPIDVTGYTEMWWQNDEYKEGFIASHSGPCEAWIDDVRIFHHDNCAAEFTSYPAKVPADYSSCKGDCLFSFYWLALHESDWQIYKQCVPITNSGSSTTTQSSGSSETVASDDGASETEQTTNTAPVATTSTPTATTATPETSTNDGSLSVTQSDASTADEASSGEQMDTTTPAPEATTTAPDVATDAPVSTPEATEAPPAPASACVVAAKRTDSIIHSCEAKPRRQETPNRCGCCVYNISISKGTTCTSNNMT